MSELLTTIRGYIPESYRNQAYRYAQLAFALLSIVGLTTEATAAVWGQLVVGLVTLLFAALYSPSTLVASAYAVLGLAGAVFTFYGLGSADTWAQAVAAVGVAFGITVAAARTDAKSTTVIDAEV